MKNYVAFPYIISYKICVKNIPSAQCKVSEGGERAKRKKSFHCRGKFYCSGSFGEIFFASSEDHEIY